MSIQVNQYLCYGYLFDYKSAIKNLEERFDSDRIEEIFDSFNDSAFSSDIAEVDGLSMLVDGMSGEYVFFGKVFDKSDNYEPLQTTVMPKVSSKVKKLVKEGVVKYFGEVEVIPSVVLMTMYR